jgi:hypothetical protein
MMEMNYKSLFRKYLYVNIAIQSTGEFHQLTEEQVAGATEEIPQLTGPKNWPPQVGSSNWRISPVAPSTNRCQAGRLNWRISPVEQKEVAGSTAEFPQLTERQIDNFEMTAATGDFLQLTARIRCCRMNGPSGSMKDNRKAHPWT